MTHISAVTLLFHYCRTWNMYLSTTLKRPVCTCKSVVSRRENWI